MPKPDLTIKILQEEANVFAQAESVHDESKLYGVTDGKAVGTYLEHKLQEYLHTKYTYIEGSSAKGIDFPELLVDMKVTSQKQPQSSSPFKSARQKIFGLGYSLLVFVYDKSELVFVYDKSDDDRNKTGRLNIKHTIFVEHHRTADFQTTSGLRKILENNANMDDILAYFEERMIPVDDVQARSLAEEVLNNPPKIGYLTISNALQWRLQYSRVIQEAGRVAGINRVL